VTLVAQSPLLCLTRCFVDGGRQIVHSDCYKATSLRWRAPAIPIVCLISQRDRLVARFHYNEPYLTIAVLLRHHQGGFGRGSIRHNGAARPPQYVLGGSSFIQWRAGVGERPCRPRAVYYCQHKPRHQETKSSPSSRFPPSLITGKSPLNCRGGEWTGSCPSVTDVLGKLGPTAATRQFAVERRVD